MEEQQEIRDEGIPFSFVIALYADEEDNIPPRDEGIALEYAEYIGLGQAFPVTADMTGTITDLIPWEGTLPGKCAVSRDLELMECWSSARNKPGLDAIREDWEARGE